MRGPSLAKSAPPASPWPGRFDRFPLPPPLLMLPWGDTETDRRRLWRIPPGDMALRGGGDRPAGGESLARRDNDLRLTCRLRLRPRRSCQGGTPLMAEALLGRAPSAASRRAPRTLSPRQVPGLPCRWPLRRPVAAPTRLGFAFGLNAEDSRSERSRCLANDFPAPFAKVKEPVLALRAGMPSCSLLRATVAWSRGFDSPPTSIGFTLLLQGKKASSIFDTRPLVPRMWTAS